MKNWIKRHPKWSVFIGVMIGLPLVLKLMLDVSNDRGHRERIPERIKLSRTLFNDGDFMASCGVAAFQLSDKTLEDIRQQGLAFFKDATIGKNGGYSVVYKEWQPTPLREYRDYPLGKCAKNISKEKKDEITKAVRAPGGFYTDSGSDQLLVVPDLRMIVIFSYD